MLEVELGSCGVLGYRLVLFGFYDYGGGDSVGSLVYGFRLVRSVFGFGF